MEHCGKNVFFKNGRFYIQHENGVDCILLDLSALRGRDGGRGSTGAAGAAGAPGAQAFSFGHDTDASPDRIQVIVAPFTALTDGFAFEVENLGGPNTGLPFTLNLNGIADKAVVDSDGNPLTSNMLVADTLYLFAYDGDNDRYQLLGLAKPGPEMCFEPGAGSESCQQINTALPNNASGDHSIAMGSGTDALSVDSHSEGKNTQAGAGAVTGNAAHAEGTSTLASGPSSHAEGNNTIASAQSSHAEGNTTVASGSNSHTEGRNTVASNDRAHAEGDGCIASGPNSHAEGEATTASGQQSHAEGGSTIASSSYSHAEGIFSQAITNTAAHAEGESTIASGLASHAQGRSCIASATASHAEGEGTIASGFASHSGGEGTRASGLASFNHSKFVVAGDSIAAGNHSAILAGVSNNTGALALRAVVLGGTGRTELEPDYTNVHKLRIFDAPEFANDVAAGAGGLTTGAVYATLTGTDRILKIKI